MVITYWFYMIAAYILSVTSPGEPFRGRFCLIRKDCLLIICHKIKAYIQFFEECASEGGEGLATFQSLKVPNAAKVSGARLRGPWTFSATKWTPTPLPSELKLLGEVNVVKRGKELAISVANVCLTQLMNIYKADGDSDACSN
jgi:hypothetical protein